MKRKISRSRMVHQAGQAAKKREKLKAGTEVLLKDGQEGCIAFACGKESFMVHLLSGSNVMVHKSALTLKPEPPPDAPQKMFFI